MGDANGNPGLVACCGLYCGECGSFKSGKCPGCAGNEKATWCAVRACCREHSYASCADCKEHADPAACAKFNSFMSRVIGFVINSDRRACVLKIRECGREGYASFMASRHLQRLPRRGPMPS